MTIQTIGYDVTNGRVVSINTSPSVIPVAGPGLLVEDHIDPLVPGEWYVDLADSNTMKLQTPYPATITSVVSFEITITGIMPDTRVMWPDGVETIEPGPDIVANVNLTGDYSFYFRSIKYFDKMVVVNVS